MCSDDILSLSVEGWITTFVHSSLGADENFGPVICWTDE